MGKASKDGKRDALERMTEMFDRSPVALTLADLRQGDQPLVIANRAFCALTGYARDEVLGRNCRFLQADLANGPARAEVHGCIAQGGTLQVVFHNRRKDGEAFENLLFLQCLVEADGSVGYALGSQFLLEPDVTEGRIDRHLSEFDAAVDAAVSVHENLRSAQRRMLADAAHSVATAWLTLR